jgi:photosystem II stability/assembly factor-like uncharacterized protein
MRKMLRRGLSIALVIAWTHVSSPASAQTWVNITGNLANLSSECGNLPHLSAVPGSSQIIAGVAQRGLWVNTTGSTWAQLGTGSGSDTITNRPSWIVYDPANASVFWESGIYNSGGVYKTTDGGTTFRRLGTVAHNDYVSVDFSDPNRRLLLAGGHEQSQTVYRSTDGGLNWTNIGLNLPANTKFSGIPHILTPQTYVVNASGWGSIGGIYRTTNAGVSWQRVSDFEPSLPPLVASDGAIYWPLWNGLIKSTDAGITWTQIGNGLMGITPVELPDRRLISISGRRLMASTDGGSTWAALGPTMPYDPAGVVYSPGRRAFFIWHWDCGAVVLPDAVMRFDYEVASSVPGPPTNLRIVPNS